MVGNGMTRRSVYVHEETYRKAEKLLKERGLTISKYLMFCLTEFLQSIEGEPIQKPLGQMTIEEFLEVSKYWMEKVDEFKVVLE